MVELIPYVDSLERITDQEVFYANHYTLYPIKYHSWVVIVSFSGELHHFYIFQDYVSKIFYSDQINIFSVLPK
jgi:hypothetical protein